jgi:uncharacterized protein YndB with AHSA1/START domain
MPRRPDYAAALVVRRRLRASPERLFDAWTDPLQLVKWWGPEGVDCIEASIDLRTGGTYRIANRFPDASVLWIRGEYEVVDRPRLLAFSWQIEGSDARPERVTVQFIAIDAETEVVVTHERIADATTRERHAHGWAGCLDGLSRYLSSL